jgi:hypothetical protein
MGEPYIYELRLTAPQFILVRDSLLVQRDNFSIDLGEIEDRHQREMIRQALAVRRTALNELIDRLENYSLSQIESGEDPKDETGG